MKQQKGFTLLEMVIAISILAVMGAVVVLSYNGSKAKAQALVAAMDEYGGAQQRLKADTSCYSRSLGALFDRNDASGAAKSWCGADLSRQWNGPYVKPVVKTTDDPAVLQLGSIAPDLTLTIGRVESTYSGSTIGTYKWYIVAQGVPSEIATQALVACNGTDDANNASSSTTAVSLDTRKCVDSVGGATLEGPTASSGELKDVFMLFDETRR